MGLSARYSLFVLLSFQWRCARSALVLRVFGGSNFRLIEQKAAGLGPLPSSVRLARRRAMSRPCAGAPARSNEAIPPR